MDIINQVVMNIVFLIGPVCGFYALRGIVDYFLAREK